MSLLPRLGRPDVRRHADLFDVPTGEGLTVTFVGVSTLLLDDGESALLVDGFFSRPGLARVALGRLSPDLPRIDAALARLGLGPGRRSRAAVAPGTALGAGVAAEGEEPRHEP